MLFWELLRKSMKDAYSSTFLFWKITCSAMLFKIFVFCKLLDIKEINKIIFWGGGGAFKFTSTFIIVSWVHKCRNFDLFFYNCSCNNLYILGALFVHWFYGPAHFAWHYIIYQLKYLCFNSLNKIFMEKYYC